VYSILITLINNWYKKAHSTLPRRPSLFSWWLAILPVPFLVVTRPPFGISWRFPRVSRWPFFTFPVPVIFCLPSLGAATLESAWLSTAPSPQLQHADRLVSLRRVGGDWLPQNARALLLWSLAARSTACSSRACLRTSFTVFSPHRSSWIFMSGSSTPSASAFPLSLCGVRADLG
jgi:hypothetical protein